MPGRAHPRSCGGLHPWGGILRRVEEPESAVFRTPAQALDHQSTEERSPRAAHRPRIHTDIEQAVLVRFPVLVLGVGGQHKAEAEKVDAEADRQIPAKKHQWVGQPLIVTAGGDYSAEPVRQRVHLLGDIQHDTLQVDAGELQKLSKNLLVAAPPILRRPVSFP
ncbi:hypothetical protein [Streptomyces cyaneofuscatus]|uniref:hypothetical protein n=1 Tax=Streptomyces cyaneofuscatus TaxID=66883 RepID=UPI0038061859